MGLLSTACNQTTLVHRSSTEYHITIFTLNVFEKHCPSHFTGNGFTGQWFHWAMLLRRLKLSPVTLTSYTNKDKIQKTKKSK